MPKLATPLTDTEIRQAKPKDKDYSLSDGQGLGLLVTTHGSKLWRFRYTRPGGGRNLAGFGKYPAVSLVQARKKRAEWLDLLYQGIDPVEKKQEAEQQEEREERGQFHLLVREWADSLPRDRERRYRYFERDLFPYFCDRDSRGEYIKGRGIASITHKELTHSLTEKAKTSRETAHRILTDCRKLWRFAISHGYTEKNITDLIDPHAIPKPEVRHYPKITDPDTLRDLMFATDRYHGQPITRLMLKFVLLAPLRADNLCNLRWDQVNIETGLIIIPRHEMKVKDSNLPDFTLPLSTQAIEVLKEAHILTGWGQWVFHGLKNIHGPINKESANKALRIMGFTDEVEGRKQTLHSFRGTFRSLAETHHEQHGARFETMERCLDHHERSGVVRAYNNQSDYTTAMRKLLQWWADWLDEVRG